ncbi:hypothetical protein AKJ08_0484 [Vulgatibacter incomptus]|uniref:Uncharacterized protein n=1 Tax=Vulgatibacter incomptus TaxID=1391653 RepID=A0A0K1P9B0_9BACT|nr:hypothetical protein AKJ08_0484 [Vulgatibacter incomptus]
MLDLALQAAEASGAEIRRVDLTALRFEGCPSNERQCRWPCLLTEGEGDELGPVYDRLVDWADVVVISSVVDDGALAEPLDRFMKRLGCIRHALEVDQVQLIRNKVASFLLCGPWKVASGPAAELVAFFASLGFALPPFPIAGPPPDSCFASSAERSDRLLHVLPESADGATALVVRAIDLASKLRAPGPSQADARLA